MGDYGGGFLDSGIKVIGWTVGIAAVAAALWFILK